MRSTVCIAEDRATHESCLRVLLVSLAKHCPGRTISLFCPAATAGFLGWLRKAPQVRLQADDLRHGLGWNIKPQAVMYLLERGYDEVIWIDSDIIVNQDIESILSPLPRETLLVSEHTLADERYDGEALRARLWGLQHGRVLPFALSSGVLRVTTHHYHLMERWWDLLQSKAYQEQQTREWRRRPVHMLGDQDVLTALLTSKEFSDTPISVLEEASTSSCLMAFLATQWPSVLVAP